MTLILGFLAELAPLLPALINIAGFLIKLFGASADNLKQYQDMIQKNKDLGLITVETYQKLSDWHREMINAANAKADALKKLAQVHEQELANLQASKPLEPPLKS